MTIRRLKTYTGSQGFVYQYYFVGQRTVNDSTEYIFDVTSDRKITYPVRIALPWVVVAAWGESHLRQLSAAEQYAAVKLRLFQAFDELNDMQAARNLQIDGPFLEESLASLGVE